VKVSDVEVTPLLGGCVLVSIPTDNIPAHAVLDRGETFMLADELVRLARRTEIR
jgi:hypothetical protein